MVKRVRVQMRTNECQREQCRVSHLIFADKCYLIAASQEETSKMIEDTTEESRKRGLGWKEDQMELMALCFEEEVGDVLCEYGGWKYIFKNVEAFRAMGAMITQEVDSMSAVRLRMRKADKALWMDMKFYQNNGIPEGRKRKRYRDVVQSCLLHSCESWSWNKEMVDALHGWESRKLDVMSTRKLVKRGLNLEWFRANP